MSRGCKVAKRSDYVVREISIEEGPVPGGYSYSIERWLYASGKWEYVVQVEYDFVEYDLLDGFCGAFANDSASSLLAAREKVRALLSRAKCYQGLVGVYG